MEQAKQDFMEWLDKEAIADAVIEALEDAGCPITLNNMKLVWLDELGNCDMSEAIDNGYIKGMDIGED